MKTVKVKQIINSVLNSNCYIVYQDDSPNVWLVDAGDADCIKAWINEHGKTIKGIFVTHSHYDHIYGLNDILSHAHDFNVYISLNGKMGLYSDRLNFSRYHYKSFVYKGDNVIVMEDRQRIEIFEDVDVVAFKTVGHDISCLSYRIGDILFTGDSYIPGIKVVTTFPNSDKIEAEKSVDFIKGMKGIKVIYPGHGNKLVL